MDPPISAQSPTGSHKLPGTPRGRVRDFIKAGSDPESGDEFPVSHSMTLRDGTLFPFVIAIVPSYNEEESIERTIKSLRDQTRPPDEIIVLADNCTDDTVALSLATGVSVWQTQGNEDGKAGALNQLFSEFLDILDQDDSVLVMDADTVLTEGFIEATVKMLFSPSKKPIAGVGGIFLADDAPWNMVRQLQSNEYVRYQRRLSRRQGRALVMTGTGTMFRAAVLREVRDARRAGRLPDIGKGRSVYDLSALTEDNELTLSVKVMGYRVVSPRECTVKTAMMPSWASLFKQRRRWQRGALENLLAHGINRHTLPYLLRQILTHLGVFFPFFYLLTLTTALITQSSLDFLNPLWVSVAVLYVVEQTFSVRKGGWKAIGVSLMIVPELVLNSALNMVYIVSFWGLLWGTDESWGRMRNLRVGVPDDDLTVMLAPTRWEEIPHHRHSLHHRHAMSPRNWTTPPKQPRTLHGTHYSRHSVAARIGAAMISTATTVGLSAAFVVPFVDLQLAWNIISVYVLIGALATLVRLIPVKTF